MTMGMLFALSAMHWTLHTPGPEFQFSSGILAHSSGQNWCNWVRFVGRLARLSCPQATSKLFLSVCLGRLSIWKTHLRPCFSFLTDVLRCCLNIFTCSFFMMLSIFWGDLVPAAAKEPQNMMLPPPCFTVAMVFSGLVASSFFLQM